MLLSSAHLLPLPQHPCCEGHHYTVLKLQPVSRPRSVHVPSAFANRMLTWPPAHARQPSFSVPSVSPVPALLLVHRGKAGIEGQAHPGHGHVPHHSVPSTLLCL